MSILNKFLSSIRLNDDFDEDDAEFFDDDEEFDEEEDEKPKHRFFKDNDDDDEVKDNKPKKGFKTEKASKSEKTVKSERTAKSEKTTKSEKATQQPTSSKVTPMRNKKQTSSISNMEVCVIKPTSMEDTREIADTLLDHCTVVLNLEGIDVDVAQRVIDFSSGACYAIDGRMQKISSYIFILTPANVEISGDFQEILNSSFDSTSARKSY